MTFLTGLKYNFQGLLFSLKTPKLLFWGLIRFALVVFITVLLAGVVFAYHDQVMGLLWNKPQSLWILWLWYILSWLLALLLAAVAAIISFLISQIIFSVMIMDHMSRLTENKIRGSVREPVESSLSGQFFFLIKQEIPRTLAPISIALLLMILSWFIFLGPVMILVAPCLTTIFLAWDNTDLVPARRLKPFRARFRYLLQNIPLHLGFGLPFLIPVLNLVLLSYAPVGGTLLALDRAVNRET